MPFVLINGILIADKGSAQPLAASSGAPIRHKAMVAEKEYAAATTQAILDVVHSVPGDPLPA